MRPGHPRERTSTGVTIVDPTSASIGRSAARFGPPSNRAPRASAGLPRLAHAARRPAPRQIGVVDSNALLRAGLPLILTGFRFPGIFATTDALLAAHPEADLVLFEPDTAAGPDIAAIQALTRAGYRVCVYTRDTRITVLARCAAAGARGLMSKSDPVGALAAALQRVADGGTVVSPQFAAVTAGVPGADLTARQLQILSGRARGETFLSIARRLAISERTAQDHWSAIARRFDRFLKDHSPADLERSLGLDSGVAPLDL